MDPNTPGGMQRGIEAMAAKIEHDAKQLDTLRELDIDPADLENDSPLTDDATGKERDAVAWLRQRIDDIGEDAAYDEIHTMGGILDGQLGIKVTKTLWLGQPDTETIESVTIILGTGGPHIEVHVTESWGQTNAVLRGHWGLQSGEVTLGEYATHEAGSYIEYAEEHLEQG